MQLCDQAIACADKYAPKLNRLDIPFCVKANYLLEEQEIEKCQKVLTELHRLQTIFNQNTQVEDPYAQLTLARTHYMLSIHFRDVNIQEQSTAR